MDLKVTDELVWIETMGIGWFFTAFVWGSTYTTHKNAKIYRYWRLFAYYRREPWECSCISVLSKNRSFWISHIDQAAETRTNWQHSWEPGAVCAVRALILLWFQPNNLINTKSVVRDRIPAESHTHTRHNLFSQQNLEQKEPSAFPFCPSSQDPATEM